LSEHARLSLSHADTWMVCAAWPTKVEGMPDEISPEIEFGNMSHRILSKMLIEGLYVDHDHPEEQECASVAYDYAHKVWEGQGYADTTLLSEAAVEIKSTGRKDLWGSADVIIYNGKFLEIIDLKTGAGTYVDERNSAQLKLYALAAMETYNLTPEVVHLTIVQPRYWGGEDKVRSLVTNPAGLKEWLTMAVTPAAERTDNPTAHGTATERCKKCVGRHVCEWRDDAVASALTSMPADNMEMEEPLMSTMNVNESQIRAHQDLTIYDNERLSQVLMLVPVIRDYCDALEEHAQDIIMAGEHVPDYKVVATSGKPMWVGDMDELLVTLNKSRLKTEDYMTGKLRTPKQVAALKTGPAHDKPMSKALAKAIADHTGRSAGGLSLVLESDARESAAPAFTAVDGAPLPAILQEQNPSEPAAELPAFLL